MLETHYIHIADVKSLPERGPNDAPNTFASAPRASRFLFGAALDDALLQHGVG